LALPAAAPARAGIADPANCTLDPALVACPAGDAVFTVVTRDASGSWWAEDFVTLSFCPCSSFHLESPSSLYTINGDGCSISEMPNDQATSRFPVAGFGTCADLVRIDAGGVTLGYRAVASPDQDGDGVVTSADIAIVQSKVGTSDPTADFNGDGMVTAADVAFAQNHLGHSEAATGVPYGPAATAGIHFSRSPSPNPARGAVTFAVATPELQHAEITVADLTGRRIATLWSGPLAAGDHPFAWKGQTLRGEAARAGLYLVQVRGGDVAVAKLFTLLR
jgi:hypothetical protein